ncbi:hypothetical protein [Clostridium felsineum]|uniref:Uncharacterized protein n=1 Tax=Clostridium felsineum TaxID=36839 RepID=A0A1S8LR95_9CLOT|nr:hypothetical protein [Clostridium felsineum]URZ05878.1 hypothetical protein CLROS_012100 [Clostridium felsineum]URZ10915.1 hypothetical protein CROST_016310 [Clostridium felsineum]
MAKYRYVYSAFWEDPDVMEQFTPEDKLFYLYVLTNPKTTQIGVYKITKKEMAFGLGYSIESINSLVCRFIEHHKLIKYDESTRELAIKNWGKYNLNKGGKPIIDCINKEFKEVQNIELVKYVAENIRNESIKDIYVNFIKNSVKNLKSNDTLDDTYSDTRYDTLTEQEEEKSKITFLGKSFNNGVSDDTLLDTVTIRGQKEKQKENKKQKENNNTTSSKDTVLSNIGLEEIEKKDDAEVGYGENFFVKILDYYKLKAHVIIEKPDDVVLAQQLATEGITLDLIKMGIDLAFESFKPKYQGDKIRSLKFCEGFVRDLLASEKEKLEGLNSSLISETEIRSMTDILKNKIPDGDVTKVIECLSKVNTGDKDKLEYIKEKVNVVESYAIGKNISYTGALIKAIKENWKREQYTTSTRDNFNSYGQRKYDYDDLEKRLLEGQGFYN